jgi:hypothetical protein
VDFYETITITKYDIDPQFFNLKIENIEIEDLLKYMHTKKSISVFPPVSLKVIIV